MVARTGDKDYYKFRGAGATFLCLQPRNNTGTKGSLLLPATVRGVTYGTLVTIITFNPGADSIDYGLIIAHRDPDPE